MVSENKMDVRFYWISDSINVMKAFLDTLLGEMKKGDSLNVLCAIRVLFIFGNDRRK